MVCGQWGSTAVFLTFFGEFSHPGDPKKKGWRIQQRDFKDFKKQIRHILTKKTSKSPDLDIVFL
jgi:hypothetical protein